MKIYQNSLYLNDIKRICSQQLPWEKLSDKTILLSGATGMIGSFLIDVIMQKNKLDGLSCKIYALGRNAEKANQRFEYCYDDKYFAFIACDINQSLEFDIGEVNYVLHLASNTHPLAYSSDPVGTITTNIIGTNNLLKFAVEHQAERFLFASSVEVYGENRGDVEKFDESYLGYLDCNTLRAGYPESKRCGEALCQAYICQRGVDAVIPRLPRTFGPTMQMSDTKAISQFIKKAVAGEDIVLKSEGTQLYSYCYVGDVVLGLLTCMLKGKCGEAYNIADERCNISLLDLAALIAGCVGKKVVFAAPGPQESAGYSKATKALLDADKLRGLGWQAQYDIQQGIERTIEIIRASEG